MKQILSAGGSLSPTEIGKIAGFDVGSVDFWQIGMKQYEYFIKELEKIVK
jgi:oligoendopeptidase F